MVAPRLPGRRNLVDDVGRPGARHRGRLSRQAHALEDGLRCLLVGDQRDEAQPSATRARQRIHVVGYSIEKYYQQIGRAGRDGRRADCVLFYSDWELQDCHPAVAGESSQPSSRANSPSAEIRDWVTHRGCRHQRLVAHFGERIAPCATSCDACASRTTLRTPHGGGSHAVCRAARPFRGGAPKPQTARRMERGHARSSGPFDPQAVSDRRADSEDSRPAQSRPARVTLRDQRRRRRARPATTTRSSAARPGWWLARLEASRQPHPGSSPLSASPERASCPTPPAPSPAPRPPHGGWSTGPCRLRTSTTPSPS